jgi:hypothetical protein
MTAANQPPSPGPALTLLSVVIPARNEGECIAATVEHLHLELSLNNVPHEVVVVDDGSTDRTWEILQDCARRSPALRPIKNEGLHGFGRAIVRGIDSLKGDAVVVMMADESDDCRDVVGYWKLLNEGWECVFGSRFMKGGGVIDYPWLKLRLNRLANLFIRLLFKIPLNDTNQCLQSLPQDEVGWLPTLSFAAFQSHCRVTLEGHYAWLLLGGDADHLAQPPFRHVQAEAQRDGQPISVYRGLCLAGEILQLWRLPKSCNLHWRT